MANYPGALDSAIHPGPGTFRDDPGFELDVMVSELMDRTVALETKLGIGASTPGASAAVLRRSGSGASQWAALQTADIATGGMVTKRQLNYVAATDVWSGVTLPPNSVQAMIGDQPFTVDDANSIVEFAIRCSILASFTTTVEVGTSLLVDGTTRYNVGGGFSNLNNQFLVTGHGSVFVTGMTAGSHGVHLDIIANAAAVIYLRALSLPLYEHLAITVTEHKR